METKSVTDYLQSIHDIVPALQFGLLPDGIGNVYHKFAESGHITTTSTILSANLNQDPFNDNGDTLYISSSNVGDNVVIYLEGVDINGNIAGESIALNGQTAVQLTTVFRTIFIGFNNNGTPLLGTVYVGSGATPALGVQAVDDTYCVIPSTYLSKQANQALTSIFTVPNGFTAFLTNWYGTSSKGKDVTLVAYARQKNKVFRYQEAMTNFESSTSKELPFMRFGEGTDFKVEAITSQGTVDGICTYDIILLDNDFIGKFRPLSWR